MNYLESTTASLLSSPPKYKNPKLEQKINKKKNESRLNWRGENLTDDDMAIGAYYLLQNNNVSNFVFCFNR